MAVYARGYRPYGGGFGGAPAAWTIQQEGYRMAMRSRGLRVIGVLFLVWFVIWGAQLYFTLGVRQAVEQTASQALGNGPRVHARGQMGADVQLQLTLAAFYMGIGLLTAFLALLLGAGLVADDLRTRGLTLHLVRPLRAWDYVLGKALILPRVLLWTCLLPGLLFYVLVALWQPPGESLTWAQAHLHIAWMPVQHYLIAASAYTGLMLFLSSRTDRRGVAMGLGAAILLAGSMVAGLVSRLEHVGAVGKYAGLPLDAVCGFARAAIRVRPWGRHHVGRALERVPDPDVALVLGFALLALGLWSAWRRARTVEVSA
jgi:ABC-type transport system involved in multi-copper enzyme maturation permease subunit